MKIICRIAEKSAIAVNLPTVFFQKTTMFGFDTGLVTASALDTLQ